MRKFYAFLLFAFSVVLTNAQDSVCTSHNFSNGAGSITFNVKNNSANPIMITDIKTAMSSGAGGTYSYQLLYNTTPINQPATPWTAGTVGAGQNGWQLAGSSTGVVLPTHTVPMTVMSNLTLVIPSGATYTLGLSTSGTIGYQTLTIGAGVNNFTSNGVSIQTGDAISWGGSAFPSTPSNYPRGWDGCIKWVALPPCSGTPTAGTAVSSVSNPCPNANFILSLTGATIASGITYQWQSSTNNTTWTNITGGTSAAITYSQTATSYYRAIVTCGTNSDTTASLQVTSPSNLAAGTYTINATLPASSTNFQSFGAAVAAMNCGIAGPVVFNVATGTYNEQVVIPQILNTSSVNTVRFNGNGATLLSSPSVSTSRTGLTLNGADFVTIDSLTIDVSGGTYGWGILLTGGADSNRITNCTINTSTSSTSTNHVGILINGSVSSTSSSGNNANGNLISGNTINGGYYGIHNYGSTAPYNKKNTISGNKVKDFYFYGIFNYGNDSLLVSKNDISRPTRTTGITTTYGVYISTNSNVKVEKNRVHDVYAAVTTANSSTVYSLYMADDGTPTELNYCENNAVYNINNTTGTVYGIYSPLYYYWRFYHNTIVLDDAAATAGSTYGIYSYGTDVVVKNNIVYITRGGSGTKYVLDYPTTTASSIPVSNNNVLYINSPAGSNYIGILGTTTYATLPLWQAANGGMDLQSVSVNPVFTNVATGNLYPNNNSFANIGAAVGVAKDIIEFQRNLTAPTPGAYEIIPSAGPDMGATVLVSPVQKQCYSNAETVSVTIKNYSSSTHFFAANPVTVNVSVTGPNATTFTPVIVNTGTLASNGTLNVVVSTNYNMSAGGTYLFSGSTTTAGDGNANNNSMQNVTITDTTLSAGTVYSNPTSFCVNGGIPNLTLIGGGGGSIQWQESSTGLAGSWTNVGANLQTYTPSAAVTTIKYFRAYRTCSGNGDTSVVVPVSVNNPQLINTSPAARCGAGTLTLSATVNSGSTVNWYNAATGGTLVGTGLNFTTPSLSNTTTYYAAATKGGIGANTGLKTSEFAICGFPTSSTLTDYPLRFTTTKAVTINYAWVIPAATTVTIALRAQGSTTNIYSQTFTFQPSQVGDINNPVLINLNWALPTTGNYQLTNTSGGLWRIATFGCGYPYTSPGGGFSITGSAASSTGTASTAYYNGFYQLNVTEACETARMPVLAEVSYNTAITANPLGNISTCVGSNFTLAVVATGANLSYQWRKNGAIIPNSNNDSLIINPVTLNDAGTYDVIVTGLCGSPVTSGVSIVNVAVGNTWVGKVSSDWHDANNWCGGIPTSSTDVVVFPGTPYQPVINAAADVRNLTLNNGAIVIVSPGDTLNIYGNFVNNGTFSAANSTIAFKGAALQNVDEITASNIVVNSAGVALTGNMAAAQTVTMTAGKLTLGISNLSAGNIQNGGASSYIVTNSTGSAIIKNVGITAMTVPVGPNANSYNPVTIANGGGRDYSVKVSTGLSPTVANPGLAVNRTWTVSPNIAPATAATITLQYADADMNTPGVGSGIMEVGVHDGTSWIVVTPNVTPTGSATSRQVITTTSQFGPIAVANKGGVSWITAVPSVDATIGSIQLLPNIVENKTLLRVVSSRAARLRLDVIDGNGRVVLSLDKQIMTGQNDIMLEMSKLAGGTYSISGTTDKGKTQVIRFVKL